MVVAEGQVCWTDGFSLSFKAKRDYLKSACYVLASCAFGVRDFPKKLTKRGPCLTEDFIFIQLSHSSDKGATPENSEINIVPLNVHEKFWRRKAIYVF